MNKLLTFPKYHKKSFLSLLLLLAFILSIFTVDYSNGIWHSGGSKTLNNMLSSLLKPDLSKEIITLAIQSSLQTFAYAIISISIAVVLAFILSIFASGILIHNQFVMIFARSIIGFLRAIHELIWAWLFVAAIGLNPIGGIFALAIPYAGYLGKIFSDIFLEVPKKQIESLKTNGASKMQIFIYAYLPLSLPNMLSYIMYRLECAIRSSSVLSFIGLGGIGFQIQLSLQDLKYNQVWTFMFFLIMMIIIIDKWSYQIRKRVK